MAEDAKAIPPQAADGGQGLEVRAHSRLRVRGRNLQHLAELVRRVPAELHARVDVLANLLRLLKLLLTASTPTGALQSED